MADAGEKISKELNLKINQVNSVLKLSEEGATIPFMARYRKEMTGSLDEVQIDSVLKLRDAIAAFEKRRLFVLDTIKEQGKLTADLEQRILSASSTEVLEDIYLPFKVKKQTRAEKARKKGLEGLAKIIMAQDSMNIEERAKAFVKGEVKDVKSAIAGASDIIAEWVSENSWVRDLVRKSFEHAVIKSKLVKSKKEEASKYEDYWDWEEPLKRCKSHRYLAMTRGENEGLLKVSLVVQSTRLLDKVKERYNRSKIGLSDVISDAIEDGYKRLIEPSISTEYRQLYKEKSDSEAIKVFAANLKQLLLQPPVGRKRTLAIDPGFRTGCKLVCLSDTGDLLHNETIYPHPPQKQQTQSMKKLSSLVEIYDIEAIAIGNGTAGRETEQLVKRIKFDRKVNVYVVDESGASIYSASSVGREEFPEYDVTVRGAVSIGRRLMDPLAELVKIDAKSIGVGQYQHDVNQKELKYALDRVVESAVNSVGVNLNTASKYLLQYVSGLGPQLADNIVAYRREQGAFLTRKQLKSVPRLGDKAFEQAAGFLRVPDGDDPLDNSAVHPESYKLVKKMVKDLNCDVSELVGQEEMVKTIAPERYLDDATGLPTILDVLDELAKPGRDPRRFVGLLEFDENIRSIEDLKPNMVLPGLITNVTNFGAFVDIGIKQNGLVHISQLADEFVDNPADIVSVYQKVRVKVLTVDLDKGRIQLSMKNQDKMT